jgi:hypothetical protein
VDIGTGFQDRRGQLAEAEPKATGERSTVEADAQTAKHLIVRAPSTREQSRRELRYRRASGSFKESIDQVNLNPSVVR